jgi:hypothetical protein
MWLNLIFLTPCGEPSFAFWLMALLSHQQHLPFTFDVELNREISIFCNFGWIIANKFLYFVILDGLLQTWCAIKPMLGLQF